MEVSFNVRHDIADENFDASATVTLWHQDDVAQFIAFITEGAKNSFRVVEPEKEVVYEPRIVYRDGAGALFSGSNDTIETAVRAVAVTGNKIAAILLYRHLTDFDFKESKDYVDALFSQGE